VLVATAALASSSIPGLLPPIQLLSKDRHGNIQPYLSMGSMWRDGSFQEELPFEALHQMFNVTFTVVSQTEPHITPFFYENRGSAGQVSPTLLDALIILFMPRFQIGIHRKTFEIDLLHYLHTLIRN
jgi:predicted acylesterase/phospholipase RssA